MESSSRRIVRPRISFTEIRRFFIDDEVKSVARRLFVTNAVDSLLAYAGAVVGNYVSGNTNPYSYIATGIGLALSISLLSNFLTVFLVEEAERRVELISVSRHMLKSLDRSILGRAPRIVALYVAMWSAIGAFSFPTLASLAFIPAIMNLAPVYICVTLSLGMVVCIMFCLGLYLGKLIGRGAASWGAKFAIIGLIPLVLSFILR